MPDAINSETHRKNELDKLYRFMTKYKNVNRKKSKTLPYTHTLMSEPYGSYNIPEDARNMFLNLYIEAIVAGHKPSVTEKHKEFGPIVIDFDFVQKKENSERYYNEITIKNIVKLYNSIVEKYLDVKKPHMVAYVSEKKEPTLRNGQYHDGIHIVYPYICTKPSLQMLMRTEFIKMATEYKIFKKIPLVNTNGLETVFDKNVIYNTGWMLYGSRKDASSQVYYVTHIYKPSRHDKIFDTLPPGENINKQSNVKHFVNLLSCRRFFSSKELTPLADGINPLDIDNQINSMKRGLVENNRKENITKLMGEDINFIRIVPDTTLEEAQNLVKLLSKERATEYYSWYQVGKCLHNIDHRLLDDWIEFSKQCPEKFDKSEPNECEKLWKKMRQSNYTIATLHYFASKDNPEEYSKLKEEKINKLVHDGLEASHRTIAKLIMEKFKFVYKCASIKHNVWYEFKNHRWVEIDSAYSLRNLISDELTSEYGKVQAHIYDMLKQETNDHNRKNKVNEAAHVSRVIKQLNDSRFKNGVIRECADIAYDPNFLKNLDENIHLICFENGIYDLETNNFREGCPDDYISLCTGYDYIEYDKKDEICNDITEFMKKIQPDKTMRKYLLTLLSTCLSGAVAETSFYVFTGSGANGKSKLMELLRYSFGDYFKPMDIRLITEKRSSSSTASPELADKKGIRLCPFDEPKATDEINTGFMKYFTGGDMITARALFREPIYFKPQFKPFLLCNKLPNIRSDDDGTWRRIKVIPFLCKFIKRSDATKAMLESGLGANEFWADPNLSEKLPEWKQMFMSKLIKYYKKYREGGLSHPDLVMEHTNEYRRDSDVFQDYVSDQLDKTDDVKDAVSIQKLYDDMRDWYKKNGNGGKCPTQKELRKYVAQRVATYNQKMDAITHYRFKSAGENLIDALDG